MPPLITKPSKELCEYPPIMTVTELAEFLRISPKTIYNKRSDGSDLPPQLNISRKIVFSRKSVEKWLQTLEGEEA